MNLFDHAIHSLIQQTSAIQSTRNVHLPTAHQNHAFKFWGDIRETYFQLRKNGWRDEDIKKNFWHSFDLHCANNDVTDEIKELARITAISAFLMLEHEIKNKNSPESVLGF